MPLCPRAQFLFFKGSSVFPEFGDLAPPDLYPWFPRDFLPTPARFPIESIFATIRCYNFAFWMILFMLQTHSVFVDFSL